MIIEKHYAKPKKFSRARYEQGAEVRVAEKQAKNGEFRGLDASKTRQKELLLR